MIRSHNLIILLLLSTNAGCAWFITTSESDLKIEAIQSIEVELPDASALEKRIAAVVMAEAWQGQEADIRWIYYNNVEMLGPEKGLNKSSAYRKRNPWYQCWLYLMGDEEFAGVLLPQNKYFEGKSVREYCQSDYMMSEGKLRAAQTLSLVVEMYEPQRTVENPYPGWIGQGNVNDFNHSEPYWQRSRQYFWLQEEGLVSEKLVQILPAGPWTQFVFDANKILEFSLDNPKLFEGPVPEYPMSSG